MNKEVLEPSNDARLWAMLCHLTAFLGWVFPFGNIIGPLVVWVMKKKEYPAVDREGKESLNCQLSYTLYAIIFGVALLITGIFFSLYNKTFYTFLVLYIILGLALFGTYVISMIVAAIKAYNGNSFRYPLIIRFIK